MLRAARVQCVYFGVGGGRLLRGLVFKETKKKVTRKELWENKTINNIKRSLTIHTYSLPQHLYPPLQSLMISSCPAINTQQHRSRRRRIGPCHRDVMTIYLIKQFPDTLIVHILSYVFFSVHLRQVYNRLLCTVQFDREKNIKTGPAKRV